MAESEVTGDVIKCTQETLGKFVKKPALTEKLLKKPPFRFLFDIFKAVIKDTGYFDGLYSAAELNYENIKDRDDKIKFLQKMIDAIKIIVTDPPITVRPSKIVAGQEPEKTNELLQLIGKVLEEKLDWKSAVQQLGNSKNQHEKPKEIKSKDKEPKPKEKTKEKAKETEKKLKGSKNRSPNAEKADKTNRLEKDKPKENVTTKTSKDKGNDLKKETKRPALTEAKEKAKNAKQKASGSKQDTSSPVTKAMKESESETVKARQKEKLKERESEKAEDKVKEKTKEKYVEKENTKPKQKTSDKPSRMNSTEDTEQAIQHNLVEQQLGIEKPKTENKLEVMGIETNTTTANANEALEKELQQTPVFNGVMAETAANEQLASLERMTSGKAESRTSSAQQQNATNKSSRHASASKSRTETPTHAVQQSLEMESIQKEPTGQPINSQPPEPTAQRANQSQHTVIPTTNTQTSPMPLPQRENTFTHENSRESTTNKRPRTSLRPPSARPASARPGAPRRRDKNIEIILQPNDPVKLSGISVKLETFGDFDDDGENLVVIEDANMDTMQESNSALQNSSDMDTLNDANKLEQQGHLVQQILETQKELVQQPADALNKPAKELDNMSSYNARQSSARQMTSLRDVIQALTKSVNPLGKLMDFIPEDIDAMQLELTMWRDSYAQAASELKRERSLTESTMEPMKNQLTQIELNIKEYVEMIDASRMKIIQNSDKILKLLMEQ